LYNTLQQKRKKQKVQFFRMMVLWLHNWSWSCWKNPRKKKKECKWRGRTNMFYLGLVAITGKNLVPR